MKGCSNFYNAEILNSFKTGLQLKDRESAIKNKIKKLLTQLTAFKFVATLVLVPRLIESEDKTKYDTFYSYSKAETIIIENDIDDKLFKLIYTTVKSNIQKLLGIGSGWITDSVIEHNIYISKYNPLAGSSYIKLLKERDDLRKGLINVQNKNDNKCFKWSLPRYLNLANHHPASITKADKDLAKKL